MATLAKHEESMLLPPLPQKYKILERAGLKCKLREGTSDEKVWGENITKPQIMQHNFLTLSPEQKWLDLGGYIGTFALFLLAKGISVFSVEAYPPHVELYKENMRLNGYPENIVTAAVIATLPESGFIDLHVAAERKGYTSFWGNSIHPRWKSSHPIVSVPAISLDLVFKQGKTALGNGNWNLKLDVEGAEIEILEQNNFSEFNQIFFEYHYLSDPDAVRITPILKRLEEQGFEFKLSHKIKPPKFYNEWTLLVWARKKTA